MCRNCFGTSGASDAQLGELELMALRPPCGCPCEQDRLVPSGDNVWFRCPDCAPHAVRVDRSDPGGADFPGQ